MGAVAGERYEHSRVWKTSHESSSAQSKKYRRAGRSSRNPGRYLRGPESEPLVPAADSVAVPKRARSGVTGGEKEALGPKSKVWKRLGNVAEPNRSLKRNKLFSVAKPDPSPKQNKPLKETEPSGTAGAKGKKICRAFLAGNCSYGESCRYLHTWFISNCFAYLARLDGHQKAIRGIALPSGTNKLFSGSKDGSVRIWDCETGQCAMVMNLGDDVGCMISEGPWVFAAIPKAVEAWNIQTGAELSLNGPTGQVLALEVGNETLFAGTQDGTILSWKPNSEGSCFEPGLALTGHQLAVISLVVGRMRLYSGSIDHTIRVWDLETLECKHTLVDHTSAVMSLLCWDHFLLSCSLDSTIKVWGATESGKLEVTYTHNEEHGVLALCGVHDDQGKPVLICSCNDNTVRLYDLPSFMERGRIFSKEEVRAIQRGPGGLFFTGDGQGELKVWKWLTSETPDA